ncbi:hypothetical protein Ciccas_004779 [Cichlidogyrus casuarinus]|uniref:Uncharacterized protein n=1 Tax=Cichlidogyrus casuarinus TaxID=1844966 RepID=A0ABD2QAJ4_9PLAT
MTWRHLRARDGALEAVLREDRYLQCFQTAFLRLVTSARLDKGWVILCPQWHSFTCFDSVLTEPHTQSALTIRIDRIPIRLNDRFAAVPSSAQSAHRLLLLSNPPLEECILIDRTNKDSP